MIKVYSETLCKVQISHLDNTHVPARKKPVNKNREGRETTKVCDIQRRSN